MKRDRDDGENSKRVLKFRSNKEGCSPRTRRAHLDVSLFSVTKLCQRLLYYILRYNNLNFITNNRFWDPFRNGTKPTRSARETKSTSSFGQTTITRQVKEFRQPLPAMSTRDRYGFKIIVLHSGMWTPNSVKRHGARCYAGPLTARDKYN